MLRENYEKKKDLPASRRKKPRANSPGIIQGTKKAHGQGGGKKKLPFMKGAKETNSSTPDSRKKRPFEKRPMVRGRANPVRGKIDTTSRHTQRKNSPRKESVEKKQYHKQRGS